MLKEAARYADRAEGVCWFKVNQLHGLVINEQIAIRFKKFDCRIIPSNIRTQQVVSFRSQRHIEGIDAIHHLEVGYNLDSLEKEIAEVFVEIRVDSKATFGLIKLQNPKLNQLLRIFLAITLTIQYGPRLSNQNKGQSFYPLKMRGEEGLAMKRINGEMLTLAREYRAMTSNDLAKKSGVTQSLIAKIESGMKVMKNEVLCRLSR